MNFIDKIATGMRMTYLEGLHQSIVDFGDEDIYAQWIEVVPDEPSDADFENIAEDEELYQEVLALYKNLMEESY